MTTTTRTSGASLRTLPRSPTASPDQRFILTLWTADPVLAGSADAAGVDRIGVDLEQLGKASRQSGLETWVSSHTERDLEAIRAAVEHADLFARVNPLNAGSGREIAAVLGAGAAVVMLPMVVDVDEVERFVDLIAGRALVVLLVEQVDALRRLDQLLAVDGVGEIHIGLNDLAISLGLPNRWLALADDLLPDAGRRVQEAGLRFGLGGIGRAGDQDLPMPADLVYAEYARIGATAALVSRSFIRPGDSTAQLAADVARARARLDAWRACDGATIEAAHAELVRRARAAQGW